MLLIAGITLNCLVLTMLGIGTTQAYPSSALYHQRHALYKRHHASPYHQLDNMQASNRFTSDNMMRQLSRMSSSAPEDLLTPVASTQTVAATPTTDDAAQIVVGKFKAPSPDKIQKSRVKSTSGAQVMSASMRVSDGSDDKSILREKTIHGKVSGPPPNQRYVSAKIQVSDEGLNYKPSKLSADIYGNVAEIITAPPEAIDGDFLLNSSSYFNADENDQQHALREARRQRT